jgi:hypothetical protein
VYYHHVMSMAFYCVTDGEVCNDYSLLSYKVIHLLLSNIHFKINLGILRVPSLHTTAR